MDYLFLALKDYDTLIVDICVKFQPGQIEILPSQSEKYFGVGLTFY